MTLFHKLFLRPKPKKISLPDLSDREIIQKIINWQENKFDQLKDETTNRILANRKLAEDKRTQLEEAKLGQQGQLNTFELTALAPVYQETIACADILIRNLTNEIAEADRQLKIVEAEENKIKEILADLHVYYSDENAEFIIAEARKANVEIVCEREAIELLLGKLSNAVADSAQLLSDIRDGKLKKVTGAAANLELGYSPQYGLEHPGHETGEDQISTGLT